MFQYAISDGEGTLIDHGTVSANDLAAGKLTWASCYTLIIEACARGCGTGQ